MCAAEMPTLLKAGPAPAMCTTQGGPSTCLSTPLTTPASVGPSAAAYVLLDTCLAGWRLSQESKTTWHPKATQTLIENDPLPPWSTKNVTPEYENYGCWNEWVCTCFAPVLQATSGTRDTKSETEL